MIVIGIDPHKASVTAAALSSASATLGHRRLATTARTGSHLISWAAGGPDRLWAPAGAAGLGHGVASSWSQLGSGWSTCPPNWPPAPGCSARAAPARRT